MKVIPTEIEGVVLLEPEVFGDARGYFFESYSEQSFDRLVRPVRFVQDNESMSKYGVLRGLHFQRGAHAQSKLPGDVVLSPKDSCHPRLEEAAELFDYNTDYYA